MAPLIYLLCAGTSLLCFALLFRAWSNGRQRLLFWSALCFAGLAVNNFLLALDKLVFTNVDLSTYRLSIALVAMLLLLYGLIWEEK